MNISCRAARHRCYENDDGQDHYYPLSWAIGCWPEWQTMNYIEWEEYFMINSLRPLGDDCHLQSTIRH